MQRVVRGTMPEQILNLFGGGIGQMAQIGAGLGVGGVPGALVGTGMAAAARKGSEAVTARNAEIARALVAGGAMRGGLPEISPEIGSVIEALARRSGVSVSQ